MKLLTWRDLNWQKDQRELQTFCCTDDDLRAELAPGSITRTHPRLWEWQVQEMLNRHRIKRKQRWITRAGIDAHGLAAVQLTQEVEVGAEYNLAVGAVARRHRKRPDERFDPDRSVGSEMLRDTFDEITARCVAAGVSGYVLLTGDIHYRNQASMRMCSRAGFARIVEASHDGTSDGDYERWEYQMPLPDDPALFEVDSQADV